MQLHTTLFTAAIAAMLSAPVAATPIIGTVNGMHAVGGYMGEMTDIQVLSGSEVLPGTAFVFCIDSFASFAWGRHQYTVSDSFAQVMSNPGAIDKATGLLHYVMDHYYAPLLAGEFGAGTGYDFNWAMWELTADFDGTLASLSTVAGRIHGPSQLYGTIVSDLRDNFDTIGADYRSGQYDIRFLDNVDSTYQSLTMVTDKSANEVPEPSSLALILAGGFGLLRATRRKQAA